jgi:hypothetical protein
MSTILLALADRYRKSKFGREGCTADFLPDFRDRVKSAKCEAGAARVSAVEDLQRAEYESGGLLSLDKHLRDPEIIYNVRLRPAGEAWLFQYLGQTSPSAARTELAEFFQQHADAPHPGWREWLQNLANSALAGKSIVPFDRNNMALNAELLRVVGAILTWQEESLIRFASSVICKDSKRLKALESRLLQSLRAITGNAETSLENYQILEKPRSVLVHGPLVLDLPRGTLDLGLLTGPVSISETDLKLAKEIRSTATSCLTVENEDVFHELAKRNPGILLVCTSFHGAATGLLLTRLPGKMIFYHFGDTDLEGFEILRNLSEKTKRPFRPVGMDFRPCPLADPLTPAECKTVERLLKSSALIDARPALQAILDHGAIGDFEQESLGHAGLLRVLKQVAV